MPEPFVSGNITNTGIAGPRFKSTAEWLRWRANQLGPFQLDYISAAQMRSIADELDDLAAAVRAYRAARGPT